MFKTIESKIVARFLLSCIFSSLIFLGPKIHAQPYLPDCNSTFYTLTNPSRAVYCGFPTTWVNAPFVFPNGALGLAVGSNLGFNAPNPTFWTTSSGMTYWYWNGTTFINTNHSMGNISAHNIGAGANYLYALLSFNGNVFRYNGAGTASVITTIASYTNGGLVNDIVADDQDNFYLLNLYPPANLTKYSPLGVPVCSFAVTGIPTGTTNANTLAIVGNTVNVNINLNYYVGTFSGSTLNFTLAPSHINMPSDLASCPIKTWFTSSITASPNACLNQSMSLSVSASLAPLTYTWSGPGIMTGLNSSSVQLNQPGVYTCSLTNAVGCITRTSVVTYTVNYGGPILTPSIAVSGSLSCNNGTVQLTATPNTLTNSVNWSGPGIVGGSISPTLIANAGGVYTVTLSDPNNGCSGTATTNVLSSIYTLTLTPSFNFTTICTTQPGVSVAVTGATNYVWYPSGASSPSNAATVTLNPIATTFFTVVGALGACTGSAPVTVSVNMNPILQITGSNSLCAGNSVNLNATGAFTYTWQPGNLVGPAQTFSPLSTQVYTLTGENGNCPSQLQHTLTVHSLPSLTITASSFSICQGSTATLSAGGATSYTWQPGAFIGQSFNASPQASTIYSLAGTNLFGCSSQQQLTMTVYPNPTISLTSFTPVICMGDPMNLTASGANSYTWYPGGISGSNLIAYPNATSSHTVFGSNTNCTASASIAYTVHNTPSLSISASSASTCPGNSVQLTGSGADAYTWYSLGLTGSVVAVSPGITTTYTLIGVNTQNCSSTSTLQIAVAAAPTIAVTSNPPAVCLGSPFVLTASGAPSFTWYPGGINSVSLAPNPTLSSSYTVSASNSICLTSIVYNVNNSPLPIFSAGSTTPAVCPGALITMTASGANSYTWYPGGMNGSSVSVNLLANTIYTVVGEISGSCTAQRTIAVNTNPIASMTVTSNVPSICSGQTATLSASGAISYSWQPGNLSGSINSVSPQISTSYSVWGDNAFGCISMSIYTLSVSPTPSLVLTSTPGTPCAGQTTSLSAVGATSYTWLPDTIFSPSYTVSLLSPKIYTVIGQTGPCVSSSTLGINVSPIPTINAIVSSPTICSGNSITLSANGGITYTWFPGALVGQSIVLSPTSNVTYTVVGAGANGCLASSAVGVSVAASPQVFITPFTNSGNFCPNQFINLMASGALSYTWSNAVVSPTMFMHWHNGSPIVTNFTLGVTGSNGTCTSNAVYSASLLPLQFLPNIVVLSPQPTLCMGGSYTFTFSGATNYSLNGTALGSNTVTINNFGVGGASYFVQGSTPGGCGTGVTNLYSWITLSYPGNPWISPVNGPQNPICSGNTITLIAYISAPGPTNSSLPSFTWNPGGIVGQTININPSVTTVYSVVASNTQGCFSTVTATRTIYATPTPTLTLSSSVMTVCAGTPTSIVASGASTYTWYPPGTITGPTLSFIPNVNQGYTVVGTSAICTASNSVSITVIPSPTLNTSASHFSLCNGNSSTLSIIGADQYLWLPQSLTGNSIVVTPSATMVYSVIGTFTSNNCSNSQSLQLNVIPNPTITFSQNIYSVCVPNSVSLTALGAGSYTWQPGNLLGSQVVVSPSIHTTYTASGQALGCPGSNTIGVIAHPFPQIQINNGLSLGICPSGTLGLFASGAVTYTWMPGPLNGASITINNPGIYTVTGASSLSCKSNSVFSVMAFTNPTIQIIADRNVICRGESATLNSSGANTYTWSNNMTGNQIIVSPNFTIPYQVMGTDTNGCKSYASFTLSVNECVGFEEIVVEKSNYTIYPNPNQGEFYLSTSNLEKGLKLRIYNSLGQIVLELPINTTTQTIDFNTMDKGLYTADLSTEKKVLFRTKIVRE